MLVSELNFWNIAMGLAAKMMVLSPDTPVSLPKMYHSCVILAAFIPNTILPIFSGTPFSFGANVPSISCSLVANTNTFGSLEELFSSANVFTGNSVVTISSVNKNIFSFFIISHPYK